MVKSKRQTDPLPATHRGSVSVSGSASSMEHTYCVVLHVVEAINFYGREMREAERREQIIMTAALNTVDFEVEGTPSSTAETIVFNSNCIWECDMAGIKRIKTDHRPVKVIFYSCNNSERKTIGSLLLPLRGLPIHGVGGNNCPLQLKMFWHKLICVNNEFRSHKPEVLMLLAIIKKSLLHTKDFKHLMAFNEKQARTPPLQSPGNSITSNMLQSQANIYVQLLVQLGLLQVGNDPLVDCDIIEVVLQFKQVKNVNEFVRSLFNGKEDKEDKVTNVQLMFDFVGNVTKIDLKLNKSDSYALSDVLGMRFKSSLRSIRLYFQRIFYLPINMYINGTSIANYRMDFGKLLPSDDYFVENQKYVHRGSFAFERFGRLGSARELKPIMDFTFTVDVLEVKGGQQDKQPGEQQLELQKEQLDLQSVGSKAFIHEVPDARGQENMTNWQSNAEKHYTSEVASVHSLNVGAELSASEESVSESSPTRRRKFTRLLANNPVQDDAQQLCNDQVYASNQMTRVLSPRRVPEDEQDDDFVDLPEELSLDSDMSDTYGTVEKPRKLKTNSVAFVERQPIQNTARNEKNFNNSEYIDSHNDQLELKVDETTTPVNVQEQMQLKPSQMPKIRRKATFNNADKYEIDDSNNDDSWSQLEKESEILPPPQEAKQGHRRVIKPKAIQEIKELITLKSLSDESDEMDSNRLAATHSKLIVKKTRKTTTTTIKKLSENEALSVKPNKKNALRKEDVELIPNELNTLKALPRNRFMPSVDSLNADEIVRKPRKRIVVDPLLDVDSVTESEEQIQFLQNPPNKCKNKSKHVAQAETKICETVLTRKAPKVTRTAMSKNDLSLCARWVQVSKEQTKVLQGTEMYINATCTVDPGANYNGEQTSAESCPPLTQRINIECNSELESSVGSCFIEKPQFYPREVKRQAKQLRPKTNRVKDLTQLRTERVEIMLTSEMDSTELEEDNSVQKTAKRAVHKSSLQDFLDAEETIAENLRQSQNLANNDDRLNQMQFVKAAPDADSIEFESSAKAKIHLKKCTTKATAINHSNQDVIGNPCSSAKRDRSQVKTDAQTKSGDAAKVHTKCSHHVTNMDVRYNPGQQQPRITQQQPMGKLNSHCGKESDYASKFSLMEQHIAVLEQHLRNFESRTLQMQEENSKLSLEKSQLKERVLRMELHIAQLGQQSRNGQELQQLLNEIRVQNVRYQDMSKAKDQYKRQWRRCAKQVHTLKLALYEKNLQEEYQKLSEGGLNLKTVLTQDAVEFEREYGRYRRSDAELSFSGSGDSPEPLLKDFLVGLSSHAVHHHKPANHAEGSRMH
ncbi:uncharacterized protein LOC6563527 isoform X2 [Drosophila grimshawi]|uniref:uncharacterized protein LOC6563527 isoform X2 n=1 Tax=Drosophila grimshawi TaxID=7222 RepID=UPI000C86EDC2|nr:uncharacterized protein LOC6563527 isoform X2 [Drosophila grimshawi]